VKQQPSPYSQDIRGSGYIYFVDKTGSHGSWQPRKPGDVGYDLRVEIRGQTWLDRLISLFVREPVHVVLPVVGTRTVASGVFLDMGDLNVWAEIRPRSSTSRAKLQILGGTIDNGYQGELYTVLHNFGFLPRLIRNGERYAQVVFYPAVRPMTLLAASVDDFGYTGRGSTGFGSTGRCTKAGPTATPSEAATPSSLR
jgi:deoxyuridine 5'-triphosphate nucleotidohydrolase